MDFGLDPFHAAPSLAGGEGPEDAKGQRTHRQRLPSWKLAAYRPSSDMGSTTARTTLKKKASEKSARKAPGAYSSISAPCSACSTLATASSRLAARSSTEFDFVRVDHIARFCKSTQFSVILKLL